MFVLLFLTKVFELLPYNTMAAIIIAGVMGLVEFDTAIYLLKVGEIGGGGWRWAGEEKRRWSLLYAAKSTNLWWWW
jgi:hypothetical protein